MNPSTQERPFTAQDQARQDGLLVDWIDDKPVLLDFQAGRLSSDGGMMLVGPVDGHLGLTQAMASVLHDERDPKRTKHSMTDLMGQRVFQITAGYEDQDDSDHLRIDPIFNLGPLARDRGRSGFAANDVALREWDNPSGVGPTRRGLSRSLYPILC